MVFLYLNLLNSPFGLYILSLTSQLSYKDRIKKEYIILAGIWFGPEKPNANLFIGVFHNSLKKLYRGVDRKTDSKKTVN